MNALRLSQQAQREPDSITITRDAIALTNLRQRRAVGFINPNRRAFPHVYSIAHRHTFACSHQTFG